MKLFYESVTASIIAELERGAPPWVRVWDTDVCGYLPMNLITRRPYSGINVMILWMQAMRMSYPFSGWLTFKQALAAGGCVRKGEKATRIVLVKNLVPKPEQEDTKSSTILRTFAVFNEAQIEGLQRGEEDASTGVLSDSVDAALKLVKAAQVEVRHGNFEPCYIPSQDVVLIPKPIMFDGDEHYVSTLLHECVHWTGAKHRLARDMGNRFGSRAYAAEELVAELGAAFLCAHLRVHGELRHAGYIGHWLELLKCDATAIVTASAKASQAADYLRSFSEVSDGSH